MSFCRLGKYEILNHLYFSPNFVFWRVALGRFSQCFVVAVVVVGQPWWPRFSLSPLGYDKNVMILKTGLLKKIVTILSLHFFSCLEAFVL